MANISKIKTPDGTSYDINAKTVNDHTVAKDVPSDAVFTDKNVEQIVSTGESSAFLRILTSPSQTETSETITSSVAASNFATISAQYKTIQLDGGQLLACDSRDSTKYLIFSGDDIYNHKTWDGNNTYLTDALADKANTADLATKQDSLLGGNISSGDLNTMRTVGNYYISSSTNVSNIPISALGILEVVPKDTGTATAVMQRYSAIQNNAITGVYERVYINSAWRAWTLVNDGQFLPMSGGTLTDNLTVSKTSDPYVIVKNTDITVDSSANNGVSSTETAQLSFRDSTDVYFARFYGDADTSGNINARIQARNIKQGTTSRYYGTIRTTVDKNGDIEFATAASSNDSNVTYSIVKPANFRSAIGIQDTPTTSLSNGTATSVATGTDVTLNSRTLDAGVWIIIYKVTFGANATGYRRAYLVNSDTSTTAQYQSRLTQPAVNSSSVETEITMTNVVNLSSSTTLYLRCRQNSGSTLSCTGAIRCVRLNPIS